MYWIIFYFIVCYFISILLKLKVHTFGKMHIYVYTYSAKPMKEGYFWRLDLIFSSL